jgi:hypothetical protein
METRSLAIGLVAVVAAFAAAFGLAKSGGSKTETAGAGVKAPSIQVTPPAAVAGVEVGGTLPALKAERKAKKAKKKPSASSNTSAPSTNNSSSANTNTNTNTTQQNTTQQSTPPATNNTPSTNSNPTTPKPKAEEPISSGGDDG